LAVSAHFFGERAMNRYARKATQSKRQRSRAVGPRSIRPQAHSNCMVARSSWPLRRQRDIGGALRAVLLGHEQRDAVLQGSANKKSGCAAAGFCRRIEK
jgi:hypothetical protein